MERRGPLQGQADVPLDALGLAQARRAAPMLAGFEPVAPTPAISPGPTRRRRRCAEFTGLEIITDKRLREINVGSWEGLLGAEVRAQDPELAHRIWLGEDVRRSATGRALRRSVPAWRRLSRRWL